MIQHEITILKHSMTHTLKTVNRDLQLHREGDLPAYRFWWTDGSLMKEAHYRNDHLHREGDLPLPAFRTWFYGDGSFREARYYLKGVQV
jgi:hypothetical protein